MSNQLLKVSLSPHVHSGNSVHKEMYGVIYAMIPALLVSFIFFGLGAVRVTLIAVASAVVFEYLIQKYLIKGSNTIVDGSAVITGILLAFNVPSNLPCWIIIIGSLVSIGVAKMSFGGLGQNPFNPALVGRVFMLISFPVQMTSWPKPSFMNFSLVDAETAATPLAIVKEGIKNGESLTDLMSQIPTWTQMFIGEMGGSMGEISAIALLLGGLYMIWKKIITWHIPVSMLGTMVLFSGALYLVSPEQFVNPLFHLLTGGALLGAIFMATDMVTSPMTKTGMLIYGIGIGFITIAIRVFGAYPEGVSFAILVMNAFVPLINTYFKPKRFGEVKKNG
ncbi:MAG: RnfABCDGE type electron transport complex subunit D [Bacteroidales bacterium]|nr:RnfABCDGE type electron transport complex subunit D [Bacteroidales bacterium]